MGLGPVYGPPGGWARWPIHADSAEVELVRVAQLGQQQQMQPMPHTSSLPVAQSPPARHAAAKAQFLGKLFPGDAGAQHEKNAVESLLIAQSRPSPLLAEGVTTGSNGAICLYSAAPISLFLIRPIARQTHASRLAMIRFC